MVLKEEWSCQGFHCTVDVSGTDQSTHRGAPISLRWMLLHHALLPLSRFFSAFSFRQWGHVRVLLWRDEGEQVLRQQTVGTLGSSAWRLFQLRREFVGLLRCAGLGHYMETWRQAGHSVILSTTVKEGKAFCDFGYNGCRKVWINWIWSNTQESNNRWRSSASTPRFKGILIVCWRQCMEV